MTTRQQKRAHARAPMRPKRSSGLPFIAAMTAVVVAGVVAVVMARQNPPERTRGAVVGEHWHAPYRVEICGRVLAPMPSSEGDVHTHGDPIVHVHPYDHAMSGDNANLGAFFRHYDTHIGQLPTGERGIIFPDGTRFLDGDECPDGESHELEVFANGELVEGDPATLIVHDEMEIIVRFGPEADLDEPMVPVPGFEGQQQQMPPGMDGMEITPEMLEEFEEFERQQQEQQEGEAGTEE